MGVFGGSAQNLGSPSDYLANVIMTGDANYTVPAAQTGAMHLIVGTTTNLTATRNIVLPVVAGNTYIVFNNAGGAQSLQFIGASGTGITVATGKRAIICCDGTNYVRITADT